MDARLLAASYPGFFQTHERRILSSHLDGASLPAIQAQLREASNIEISCDILAAVIKNALNSARKWQNRPLMDSYAMAFFGRVPARIKGQTPQSAGRIHAILGVQADGSKDILGFWREKNQPGFWPGILQDLKRRGVRQILMAVPEESFGSLGGAVAAAFPGALIPVCPIRAVQSPPGATPTGERKSMLAALEEICGENDGAAAQALLGDFATGLWGQAYPAATWSLRRPSLFGSFFALPAGLRKFIFKTCVAGSIDEKLKRSQASVNYDFPSAEAAVIGLSRILQSGIRGWKVAPAKWHALQRDIAVITGAGLEPPA